MSILKPTPGELYDRLAIVRLKIDFCRRKQETQLQMQFEGEMVEILEYLSRKHDALDYGDGVLVSTATLAKQREQYDNLEMVHAKLWSLESKRRALMREGTHEQLDFEAIGENAEKTTLLNDERQKLIVEINAGFGIQTKEKLYDLETKT